MCSGRGGGREQGCLVPAADSSPGYRIRHFRGTYVPSFQPRQVGAFDAAFDKKYVGCKAAEITTLATARPILFKDSQTTPCLNLIAAASRRAKLNLLINGHFLSEFV